MRGAAGIAGLGLLSESAGADEPDRYRSLRFHKNKSPDFSTSEALTPFRDATSYNNFYEFGTDKSDPGRAQWLLQTNALASGRLMGR